MSKKLMYISHPSSGLLENTLDTEVVIQELYKCEEIYNNFCIVSPIHNFGFMYNSTEYYRGLSYCTDLLEHCDIMLVIGDWKNSRGCKAEVELCDKLGIPYIIIDSSTELLNMLPDEIINKIECLIKIH